MRTKRPKKPKPPPSHIPWRCVILSVDPGDDSGAAIHVCGKLVEWGLANTLGKIEACARKAYEIAERENLPLVVVIEEWSAHGRWSHRSKETLAGSVRDWKRAVADLPRRRPTTKILRVHLSRWRAAFRCARGITKPELVTLAKALHHRIRFTDLDHNTAEAILIGGWGCYAGEVGDLAMIKVAV